MIGVEGKFHMHSNITDRFKIQSQSTITLTSQLQEIAFKSVPI